MMATLEAPTRAADRIDTMLRRHRLPLLRFIGRFTAASGTAEDVLQETMLRAWRHLPHVPLDEDGERRWLYTVARRVMIDAARRRRFRPVEVELVDGTWTTGLDQTSDGVVARVMLRQAFESLDLARREVVSELYFEGKSVAETAEKLRIPVGTVKSRAHYALRQLRDAVTV